MEKEHIAILGGGPAGSAAALELLRLGHRATIIERTGYQEMRIGESVPPLARPLWNELGLPESLLASCAIDCQGVCSSWGSEEIVEKNFIFNPYGHGWHVDRRQFDHALAEAARDRGAQLFCDSKIVCCERKEKTGWHIELDHRGSRRNISASFLIDATGRNSWLARNFGQARTTYDRQIAIARIFSCKEHQVEFGQATLVEASENGWWYSAPLPGDFLIVVYITDAGIYKPSRQEALACWTRCLHTSCHTRSRAAGLEASGPLRTFMADTYRVRCDSTRTGWVNVGAATIGLDPLSSNGICFALRSGLDAARAVTAYLDGDAAVIDDYSTSLDRFFDEYLAQRSSYYEMETRWPGSLFWSARQPATLSNGSRMN